MQLDKGWSADKEYEIFLEWNTDLPLDVRWRSGVVTDALVTNVSLEKPITFGTEIQELYLYQDLAQKERDVFLIVCLKENFVMERRR
jgi:hypothetical protein